MRNPCVKQSQQNLFYKKCYMHCRIENMKTDVAEKQRLAGKMNSKRDICDRLHLISAKHEFSAAARSN